jgi:hypothetical protein
MIVALDESGNTSTKPSEGTSRYFTVGAVIFESNDEANKCDERIGRLRHELNKPHDFEFHFTENSDTIRKRFLEAISEYDFRYIAVAINKFSDKLPQELQRKHSALYKYVCGVVLSSGMPYLKSAILIMDKSGSKAFHTSLRKYLREELEDSDGSKIKKYKAQESHKNNLLQLADCCVGVLARKLNDKKGWEDYYKYISKKEIDFIELLK